MLHTGGVTLTSDGNGTLGHNQMHDNKSSGIWFDYVNSGATTVLSSNTVANNVGDAGIMFAGVTGGIAGGARPTGGVPDMGAYECKQ